MNRLFVDDDDDAKEFWENIRFYNKAVAFTSTGGSGRIMGKLFDSRGPPSYKIQGDLYHRLGPLLLDANDAPTYSQLYIYDPTKVLSYCMHKNLDCWQATMFILQSILNEHHPTIPVFKQAFELT